MVTYIPDRGDFEVLIKENKVEGVILADQIRSLDWKVREAEKITSAPEFVVKEALAKVKLLLD